MRILRNRSILLAFALAPAGACATSGPRSITILHTNDMHGRHNPIYVSPGNATAQTGDPGRSPQSFERRGWIGGAAHLAGAIQQVRRREGRDRVLLLDGGDSFGDDLLGTLTRGEAVIRIMNAIGYDMMALGNHDFDYGADRTEELQGIARFPMRGANVLRNGSPFLGVPTLIRDIGGVQVGILTLGYHNSDRTGSSDNVRGLTFTNGIEAARRYVPGLRQRANLVIVLSHQGTKVDRELAREVSGIDLIIGAHSHDKLNPPENVNGIWIAQALSDGTMLGELTVTLGRDGISRVDGSLRELWNDQVAADPEISAIVEELRRPHRSRLETVLATAEAPIGRRYKSESPFDVLVGETLRKLTGAQVSFLPGVGYGVTLQPGPITREQVHALLPHPSKIVTMVLTGKQVLEVLEQTGTNQRPEDPLDGIGGLLQTSGLRWTIDLNQPAGRRVSNVFIGEESVAIGRDYHVVTTDGMRQGLHNYTTFARGSDVQEHLQTVTEAFEADLQRRGSIGLPRLGNVRLIPAAE